ncbi:LOW QUALITY PROTEIN: Hypothetical protein PHPALM_19643 [Phytophthora palmivora]|uniref:Integrase zinc-binding domain-containing protein n=1 Tax=Phytophthora palmivora TaxID=4796 RepID=A0A2P4XGU9_9STRA|nr:LOW QUALITY PROTEIN: Hypothetical protein PHPALM_19643 [Phytophthora palmivora]
MHPPTTVGELQQFICATNWMRSSLDDYARTIQPLQQCFNLALDGKRKTKRGAAGVSIQLSVLELEVLTCKCDTFIGAQQHWDVTEKESRSKAHIKGEQNVWADLISHWGGVQDKAVKRFKCVTRMQTAKTKHQVLRPLDCDSFGWPTLKQIAATQKAHYRDTPQDFETSVDEVRRCHAHCGLQGHRGENVMLHHIKRIFTLNNMRLRIHRFLKNCILCHHGGKVIPRQWGPLFRSGARSRAINETFCRRFGVPTTWTSDNAQHFESEVSDLVSKAMTSKQDL